MGSVVQLSAYRRPRPPAVPGETRPVVPVEADIVILPVVRIARGEAPPPVGAAKG
jgi:hypothetical protein